MSTTNLTVKIQQENKRKKNVNVICTEKQNKLINIKKHKLKKLLQYKTTKYPVKLHPKLGAL